MLRITVNKSSSGAKKYYGEKYYSEGKSTQDYYSEKDQALGTWGGKAAEKLNLIGDISKEDFASICDNKKPGTNNKLTERNNVERRVGYDFTFNASKSVSLAYTFGTDKDKTEILHAFRESVKETMSEIETGIQTRVRLKGQNENRETANIAYGEFIHFTGRPVDNVPDPHLHAHCFVFNTTYDHKEQKWKAAQFGQVNKDAPYYEAVFHATLANKLQGLGYAVEKTKTGFEIKGIERQTIEKFSRRTNEIEHIAAEKNITGNKEKSKLGAITRESKREAVTETEQVKNWNDRITPKKAEALRNLKSTTWSGENKDISAKAAEAIEYSLKHHLERKSVTTDKEILTTAIKSSFGQTTLGQIKKAFAKESSIISVRENNQTFLTTKEALHEENKLIEKAFALKGCFKPINEDYKFEHSFYNDEQHRAIQHALNTSDGITIIAGKAGTGKTTLVKEVKAGIKASGKEIFAFAPSADASRNVQRKEGFDNADTLAALIINTKLQESVKNGVIWVDEAGMISNIDMNHVLDIAKKQNARLILTGDTNQHSSVERGDALRILQTEAGIMPIQVSKIQRQKNDQYREAVSCLSKSEVDKGFKKLDKMGAIHEISDKDERISKIAADYVSSTYENVKDKNASKEVLLISPTHAEGERVTESIRAKLKEQNILNKDEMPYTTFKNKQLTVAEMQKTENYNAGDWLIFHQNTKGFKAGSRYLITGTEKEAVLVKGKNENIVSVSLDKAKNYNVFEAKEIKLSNDLIRFTGNGKTTDGKHFFNGNLARISGFTKEGNIKLPNGSIVPKDFGQFTYGYVATSHASQGKTVDKVIISQSSMSFRASSKEQFYVSVSRGRQAVSIYTDDKADLLLAVSQSTERRTATDLNRRKENLARAVEINRRSLYQVVRERAKDVVEKIKSINKPSINYELQRSNSPKNTGKIR